MKEQLFHMIQSELTKIAAHLTPKNMESQLNAMEQYMNMLKIILKIPSYDIGEDPEQSVPQSSDSPQSVELDISSENAESLPQLKPMEESIPSSEQALYTFERKLCGGRLPELGGGYHINEKIVRKLNIEHGDKLAIESTEHFPDGGTRYVFKIAQKGEGKEPANRIQINFCIAEWDGALHKFIVRRTAIDGIIRIKDMPFTLHLSEQDCEGMKDGELIDIAFYEERPVTVRVIWKHKTRNENQPSYKKTKQPVIIVEPEDDEEEEKSFPVDYDLLKGKTITLIGAEAFRSRYQQAFGEVGMTLHHITGDENRQRMERYIRTSDVVVAVVPYVGHNGSTPGNELCKSHNVPFVASKRSGPQRILLEVEQVLKRKLTQAAPA